MKPMFWLCCLTFLRAASIEAADREICIMCGPGHQDCLSRVSEVPKITHLDSGLGASCVTPGDICIYPIVTVVGALLITTAASAALASVTCGNRASPTSACAVQSLLCPTRMHLGDLWP